MEQRKYIRKILDEALSVLCPCLDPGNILIKLKATNAVSDGDVEEIKSVPRLDKQIEILLSKLKRMKVTAYYDFMKALEEDRDDLHKDVMTIHNKYFRSSVKRPAAGSSNSSTIHDVKKTCFSTQSQENAALAHTSETPSIIADDNSTLIRTWRSDLQGAGKVDLPQGDLPQGNDAIPFMPYNILIQRVVERIDADPTLLKRLKAYCRTNDNRFGVPQNALSEVADGRTFIEVLEECGLLSTLKPLYLEHLLLMACNEGNQCSDLIDDIVIYGKEHQDNALYFRPVLESKAQGAQLIKIRLMKSYDVYGDTTHLDNMTADKLLNTLHTKLGIPRSIINIIGVVKGSVILVIQLPTVWNNVDISEKLVEILSQTPVPQWIEEFEICNVSIPMAKKYFTFQQTHDGLTAQIGTEETMHRAKKAKIEFGKLEKDEDATMQLLKDTQKIKDPLQVIPALHLLQEYSSRTDAEQCLVANCRQFGLKFHGTAPADGNCFFHAVSDQLSLLGLSHKSATQLRKSVVEFLRSHPSIEGPAGTIEFSATQPDWDAYLASMSKDGEWADAIILVAMAHMLKYDILVVTSSSGTGNQAYLQIVGDTDFKGIPIMLGHIWEQHYRSLSRDHFVTEYQRSQTCQEDICGFQSTIHDNTSSSSFHEKIQEWQSRLKTLYMKRRCNIGFGNHRSETADLADPFVDLDLTVESETVADVTLSDSHTKGKKLDSNQDLFNLLDQHGRPSSHVLISGCAGSGKTSLISKIAYDWAKADDDNGSKWNRPHQETSVSKLFTMDLVFVLDICHIQSNKTLSETIAKQLLPGASARDIAMALSSLRKSCLILLDGFDEMPKDITELTLDDANQSECFVIVTTRPHTIDEFLYKSKADYSIVNISGFSQNNSFKYIEKYYKLNKNPNLADALIQRVQEISIFNNLSSYPVFLVLICHLWEDIQQKGVSLTSITRLCINRLTYCSNYLEGNAAIASISSVDDILIKLGKPALNNLLQNKLLIQRIDFSDNKMLEQAFEIGLVFPKGHLFSHDASVTFVHKIFQEYCAAVYLSSLVESSREVFDSYLSHFTMRGYADMEYVLRFCCGLNINAAEAIISHIVELVCDEDDLYSHYIHVEEGFDIESCTNTDNYDLESPDSGYNSLAMTHFGSSFNMRQNPWRIPLILLHECELSFSAISENVLQVHACLKSMERYPSLVVGDAELYHAMVYLTVTSQIKEKHIWLSKITEFECFHPVLSLNTMIKLLKEMPSLSTVSFCNESLTELSGELDKTTCMHYATINMPSLVCQTHLTDELADELDITKCMQGKNISIKTFKLNRVSISANTVTKLLAYIPSVQTFNLDGELKDVTDDSFFYETPTESLTEFRCQGSVNINALMRLLGSMPFVRKVLLHAVTLIGEADDCMLSLTSLKEFQITDSYKELCTVISTNTMMRLLKCMPSVTIIKLGGVQVTGEVDISISPSCKSLDNFMMCSMYDRLSTLSANTMMRLLACMPSVTKIKLVGVQLIGEVDDSISPSCKSLENFMICSMHDQSTTLNVNTMVKLLSCMPSLATLTLNWVNLTGEFNDTIWPSCEFLQVLKMSRCHLSANTLTSLLGFMASVITVKLNQINLTGEGRISRSCESLTNFQLNGSLISANTMMRLLSCMPYVKSVKFDDITLTGEVDEGISFFCRSLQILRIGGSMSATTMAKLLDCMPFVTKIYFQVKLTEKVNKITHSARSVTVMKLLDCFSPVQAVYPDRVIQVGEACSTYNIPLSMKSITELHMKCVTVSVHKMMTLLNSMTSVSTVSFVNVKVTSDTHESTVPLCKSLQEFQMVGTHESPFTVNANTLLRLLSYLPSVATVKLDNVALSGELGSSLPLLSESIKVFQAICLDDTHSFCLRYGNTNLLPSLSANTIARMLGSMRSLEKLSLDVDLIGEFNADIAVSLISLKELHLNGSLRASTMVRLLSCLPSVRTVKLGSVELIGDAHGKVLPSCKSLTKFQLGGSLSVNTMMRLLGCMPSVTTVTLDMAELTGEVDDSMSVLCKLLSAFKMEGSLSACTIMRLFECMPSIISVDLCLVKLTGTIKGSKLPSCRSLKEFQLAGSDVFNPCTLSVITVCKLLGCMPSVTNVRLTNIKLSCEENGSIGVLFDSIKEFQIEGSLSINSFVRLLGCMPSVSTLKLCGSLTGEVDSSLMVLCTSLKKFHLGGRQLNQCNLSMDTMMRLLEIMPSVTTLKLDNIKLTGTIDSTILPVCQSLCNFQVNGSLSANMMMRFLCCMPSIAMVRLLNVSLIGEVNNSILPFCESLEEFQMDDSYMSKSPCIMSANTMVSLLSCLPFVRQVRLVVNLTGEIDDENRLPSCNTLKEFQIRGSYCDVSILSSNTLMTLLRCMPSVATVKLDKVTLTGEVNSSTLTLCESLLEFQIDGSLSGTTLFRLLGCMPSVTSVTLANIFLTGVVDNNIASVMCKSLKELQVRGSYVNQCLMSSKTLMKLLVCMPSVSMLQLEYVKFTGEIDFISLPSCRLLEKFQMKGSLNSKVLLTLLGCMPSITALKLEVELNGDVNGSLSPWSCKSLKEFHMKGLEGDLCRMSANTIMRLLGSVPSATRVVLTNIVVNDGMYIDSKMKRLENISFSACGINCEILSSLVNSQNITSLRWIEHRNMVTEDDLLRVFSSIRLGSSTIRILALDHTTLLSNTGDLSNVFVTFLEECLPTLQELHLFNGQLSESQCAQVFTLLSDVGEKLLRNTEGNQAKSSYLPLKQLGISRCKIGNAVSEFVQASRHMLCLKSLLLKDCRLTEQQCEKISMSFSNMDLEEIDVSGNTKIMSMFSPDLHCHGNLRVLKLQNTDLTDDDVGQIPLSAFSKLTEFDLSSNIISSEGIGILAKSLCHTPALQHLSLAENNIGSNGVNSLVESFMHIPLTCLNLARCNVGLEGAIALSEAFQHLPQLRTIDLSWNGDIGAEGVEVVFRSLFHLPNLVNLSLEGIDLKMNYLDFPLLSDCLRTIGINPFDCGIMNYHMIRSVCDIVRNSVRVPYKW